MDEAIIKKIMPHSIDSEKAVIGSMIMDADAIVAASEMLTGDDFYQRQFGILFETMVELYNEGKPVDVLTLQERLKMKDVPEEFASIEYISELVDSVPISTNIRQYAQTVADDAMLRRLIRVNEEIANACYQHKESVEEIMNTTEKRIFDVIQKKSTDEYVPIQDVVLSVIDKIEAAARHAVSALRISPRGQGRHVGGTAPRSAAQAVGRKVLEHVVAVARVASAVVAQVYDECPALA